MSFKSGDRVYVRPLASYGTIDRRSSYDPGAYYVILDEKPFNNRENRYSFQPSKLEKVAMKLTLEDIPDGYQFRDTEDGETFRKENGKLKQRYGGDTTAVEDPADEIFNRLIDRIKNYDLVFEKIPSTVPANEWLEERGLTV